MTEENS